MELSLAQLSSRLLGGLAVQGRTSLLVLQALLHVGLVLRGHHPLGGGLGVVDLPSQLGRIRDSTIGELVTFSPHKLVK